MSTRVSRNAQAVPVTFNGQLSVETPIDNEVKQGDILTVTLFSIFVAALLAHAFHDWHPFAIQDYWKGFLSEKLQYEIENFPSLD